MLHVMLDLETLSIRKNACIIQIGAVLFEPISGGRVLNDKPFNRFVHPQDGFAIDAGTVAWWLQQPNASKMGERLDQGAIPLAGALAEFIEWPATAGNTPWGQIQGIWAKGSDFDVSVLAHAFEVFGVEPPWHYSTVRCCRTLFSLVGGTPAIDSTGMQAHDAEDDAVLQAMQVQQAMNLINVGGL